MTKNRRLVEEFIFRDGEGQQNKTSMPLNSIVLPTVELRYYIDPEEVEKIVASARKNGIIEPLLVRPIPNSDKYEVVAGAKRYRSAQILELAEVPVVVHNLSDEDALEIALVENFARSGLTDLEEADGVLKLLAIKLQIPVREVPPLLYRLQNEKRARLATNNVIGEEMIQMVQGVLTSLGNIKLDSFISNRLPLLNLPDDILDVLRSGKLDTSKAKVISSLKNPDLRIELIDEAIVKQLSLTEIKQKVQSIKQFNSSPKAKSSLKERVDDTFGRIKKAKWDEPKKKARLEKLLSQLDSLMKEE